MFGIIICLGVFVYALVMLTFGMKLYRKGVELNKLEKELDHE